MLVVLDILYLVLASPSYAFQVVSEKRPLGWGVATAFFSSVVFAFVLLPYPPRLVEAIFDLDRGTLDYTPLVLVWLSVFPLILMIQAGLLHLIAFAIRGKGSYLTMFCGLCFASFPLVFFAPLALLRAIIDSPSGQVIYYIGSSALFVWIIWLYVIAVRQNYRFRLGKALTACLVPFFLLILAPLLAVVISMAF